MIRRLLTTAIALAIAVAGPAAADVGAHLRKVADAYSDVFAQYPSAYTCELRSPELVASLDAKSREAWGSGHIRMEQGAGDGELIRRRPNDVNPISYYFSNCRILDDLR